MQLRLSAAAAAVILASARAHAGLVGDGTNTVQAFFYINAPIAPSGGGCDQYSQTYCEWEYNYDAQNIAQYTLPIPAHFVQAPVDGATIDVGDKQIVITNQIPATFCSDGVSSGAACTDVFTGFEFIFSSKVNITGVTVDGASAADFRPNEFAPHGGIGPISSTDFIVDLTGAAPAIGDQLVLDVTTAGSVPPAPEPSTWAMMLIGFAGIGFAAYRRTGAVRGA